MIDRTYLSCSEDFVWIFLNMFDFIWPNMFSNVGLFGENVIFYKLNKCHISYFSGCFKCINVVEPYHPERVLRQFGRVQIIPPLPLRPKNVRRGYTTNKYQVTYTWSDSFWERWKSHVLSWEERSVRVRYQWDTVEGCMDWYRRISHQIIQNPSNRSLAPGYAHGEDTNAIVLAQMTYCVFF